MTISEEKMCDDFCHLRFCWRDRFKIGGCFNGPVPTVDFTLIRRTFVKDEDKLVQALEDAKKQRPWYCILSLMIISWRLLINFQ